MYRRTILLIGLIFALNQCHVAARTFGGLSGLKKGPHKVYRLYPNTTSDLNFTVGLWIKASKHQLNFWRDPSQVGQPVDVMVPAHVQPKLEHLLQSRGIKYTVTIQDVKKLILEREVRPAKKIEKLLFHDDIVRKQKVFFDFQNYHDYDKMRAYMRTVEKEYPEIAKVYNLGYSHENRPIEMMKISYPVSATSKKSIWIDAGIHAREWASHSTAMYFMHQLVTRYGHDPAVTKFVQNLTWYITPVVNPDGYAYTRTSVEPEIRMWRKNRAPNTDKCTAGEDFCCKGVDLNRNFDFHWSESGASSNPCDETFAGSSAFSEPEARALRDFIFPRRKEIEAMITMHTYSQFWIHSYGHQRNVYPDDVNELRATALVATKALERLYGTHYKIGSGADVLYPAAGGSDDWSKSKAGIKFVYLLELRPEESVFDGFILDPSQLIPCGRETWSGVKVVANKVLERVANMKTSQGKYFLVEEKIDFNSAAQSLVQIYASTDNPTTSNPTTTLQAGSIESMAVSDQNSVTFSPAIDPFADITKILPIQALVELTSSTTSTSTVEISNDQPAQQLNGSAVCFDLATESRCSRWMYHRAGICQRIVEYMTKNCAKSCEFCA